MGAAITPGTPSTSATGQSCWQPTVAYQTHLGLLVVRLPCVYTATADLDLAQFLSTSTLVEDETPSLLDVLQCVDNSFRKAPHAQDSTKSATCVSDKGFPPSLGSRSVMS